MVWFCLCQAALGYKVIDQKFTGQNQRLFLITQMFFSEFFRSFCKLSGAVQVLLFSTLLFVKNWLIFINYFVLFSLVHDFIKKKKNMTMNVMLEIIPEDKTIESPKLSSL